uniref:Large ribosomal subunit protein bL19m n=1 Tax=Meloidogyne javanica TaxID=6303 RepID=A0A915MQ32_MELJA
MLRIFSSPYPNISFYFSRHNVSSFASKIKQRDHLPTKSTEKHEDLSKIKSKRPPVVKEKYISVKEFALSYMDFLPSQVWTRRDPLFQKLVHADMLERRMRIDIPEFYVGSIMAVTMSDPNLQQRQNRFVGICIRREKEGLHHNFTLRNVIDGLGVEVMFEIYNPTILKIETLLLEKRLDEDLTYLVDALPEYSTFSFNMESTSHPVGKPVPVNPLKVKLKPPPWLRPWFIYEVNGIEDSFTGSTPWFKRKFLQHADLMCLKRFDIIKHYRQFAQELEKENFEHSKNLLMIYEYIVEAFSNNFKKIPYKYVRPEAGNFDFALFDEQHEELNKQIDEMWSNGQQKRIPLYLPDHGLLYNIVISLSIVYNNIEEVNIILDLPTVITNKKQMKIVYHYLNRLFNCSFVFANFCQFIFNPELIKLFFENATIPGKIYVINMRAPKIIARNFLGWTPKPTATDRLLKFILDHLVRETINHVKNVEETTLKKSG